MTPDVPQHPFIRLWPKIDVLESVLPGTEKFLNKVKGP